MIKLRLKALRGGMNRLRLDRLMRLRRLVLVGAAATILYAALAWSGTVLLGLASPLASVLAYALAAAPSYFGHRLLTFQSTRPHREAAPRFAGLTILGYLIAFAAPAILTDVLGLNPSVAIIVVCVAVPAVNAVALSRLVFRAPLLGPRSRWSCGQ